MGKVRTEASTSVGGQLIPVVTVGLEVAINLARKPTLVACEQLEQEAFADVEKLRRALLCFSRRCPPSRRRRRKNLCGKSARPALLPVGSSPSLPPWQCEKHLCCTSAAQVAPCQTLASRALPNTLSGGNLGTSCDRNFSWPELRSAALATRTARLPARRPEYSAHNSSAKRSRHCSLFTMHATLYKLLF